MEKVVFSGATNFGHGLTNFGHDQFWAFMRVRKGRGRVGRGYGANVGGPKGGESKGWGPKRRKGGGPEGWGARNFALFFPSPTTIFIFSLSRCLVAVWKAAGVSQDNLRVKTSTLES